MTINKTLNRMLIVGGVLFGIGIILGQIAQTIISFPIVLIGLIIIIITYGIIFTGLSKVLFIVGVINGIFGILLLVIEEPLTSIVGGVILGLGLIFVLIAFISGSSDIKDVEESRYD